MSPLVRQRRGSSGLCGFIKFWRGSITLWRRPKQFVLGQKIGVDLKFNVGPKIGVCLKFMCVRISMRKLEILRTFASVHEFQKMLFLKNIRFVTSSSIVRIIVFQRV